MSQKQKSNSKSNNSIPQRRMHEVEWRNSWLSSWLAASVLIPIIMKIVNHDPSGIFKWTFVIALTALAGGLGIYGLLNLILLLQKRC